jgi:hypothetical protein
MTDFKKTNWIYVVCAIFFLTLAIVVFTAPIRGQVITMDTTYLGPADSTYRLFVLHHKPDSIDTNHIVEFGFERYGLGWKARLENDSMVFIYTEDPNFAYDVNRDGQVNVGDAVAIIGKVFRKQ